MPAAARLADPIGHTCALGGFLAGALIGVAAAAVAAVAIGAVATAAAAEIASGGLATPLIAGAAVTAGEFAANMIVGGSLMALGDSLGEAIGASMMGPPTGSIMAGSPNVLINGRPAARVMDSVACSLHGTPDAIGQGASGVFINGLPAARVGDKIVCGGVIVSGSGNVIIGSTAKTMAPIQPEISSGARLAVTLLSVLPGAIGLGRAIWPGLMSIADSGFLASAKTGAKAIGESLESRANARGPLTWIKGKFAKNGQNQEVTPPQKATILSGHGGWKSGALVVPKGTKLHFYSEHGATITDRLGNVIETNGDLSKVYKRTYSEGEVVHNYTLYPPGNLNIKGGTTVQTPTKLSELLKPNMGDVHWAACTHVPGHAAANISYDVKGIYETSQDSAGKTVWKNLKTY